MGVSELCTANTPLGQELKSMLMHVENTRLNIKKEWVKVLREDGFKLSHPDDGWVDREENILWPSYPQFDDDPQVGDLIMMGWEPNGCKGWSCKPARVLEIIIPAINPDRPKYKFEYVKMNMSDNMIKLKKDSIGRFAKGGLDE